MSRKRGWAAGLVSWTVLWVNEGGAFCLNFYQIKVKEEETEDLFHRRINIKLFPSGLLMTMYRFFLVSLFFPRSLHGPGDDARPQNERCDTVPDEGVQFDSDHPPW
jgi:hypothetical protein